MQLFELQCFCTVHEHCSWALFKKKRLSGIRVSQSERKVNLEQKGGMSIGFQEEKDKIAWRTFFLHDSNFGVCFFIIFIFFAIVLSSHVWLR